MGNRLLTLRTKAYSRPLHHSSKANRERLAFLFGGRGGLVGSREGSCGLRGSGCHPLRGPLSLSPRRSSLLAGRVPLGEVRKRAKTWPYKTIGYALTNRAVGWDHGLSGENDQPRVECWAGSLQLGSIKKLWRRDPVRATRALGLEERRPTMIVV
jgi:hypothetical protein